jgi:hypothetical protein
MENVLPPRVNGPLALLEGNAEADVVVCAHQGLEGLARITDVWRGELVGRRIRVRFWRRPRKEIPTDHDERVRWLFEEWERVDRWIGRVEGNSAGLSPARDRCKEGAVGSSPTPGFPA